MAKPKKAGIERKKIKDLPVRDVGTAKSRAVRGGERTTAPSISEITISKPTDVASSKLL